MVLISHLKPEVIAVVRKLILEDDKLKKYGEIFDEELTKGLDAGTCDSTEVQTIITHVNKLPTGQEEGCFLVLVFSGPMIKIMLVKLEVRECIIQRKGFKIPPKYMQGKSEKLFDCIAKSMAEFVKELRLKMLRIPLGVTFGFPIEQTSLKECKLLRWTKDFNCPDLVGRNVYAALMNSIRKFPELKRVYLIGILDESVTTLLACAWQDPSCRVGVVAGPGISCCYSEKVSRIAKYEAESYAITDMYMHIETQDLGNNGCLDPFRSEFDLLLDEDSDNPGKHINEKLVSTVYFGELARLIILRCIEGGYILEGLITDKILEKDAIKIEDLERIESDTDDDHSKCRLVLADLDYEDVSDEDCFQIQFICRCISRRSANIAAAMISTLITRINYSRTTVAAEGYLIQEYPNYKWYLSKKLRQLMDNQSQLYLRETEETGLGPAVMAALFGEETMNRDEKYRRLPGFPMDKCHFSKKGKCQNKSCTVAHPCDTSGVNPLRPVKPSSTDIFPSTCEEKARKKNSCKGYKPCNPCRGYDKMPNKNESRLQQN